jgi:riboflavin kinase/FMN adenylyltransferase
MLVFQRLEDPALTVDESVVTLGNFDGVHRGHQALVSKTVEEARRRGIASVAVTFDPHPLQVLAPERAPHLIVTAEDKIELLGKLGVDIVVKQRFDADFANLRAEDFARELIAGRLHARKIFVGRDLRFGHRREGSVEKLIQWGSKWGFEVSIVDPVLVGGARVSSSRIRQLLQQGRVEEARESLGRHHFISGTVVRGNGRGREIGYPTANISSRTEMLPGNGIYATFFWFDGRWRPSASSIGFNPTFGAGPRTVESYIFDFDRDIYGQSMKLAFVKKIRDEQKFADVASLITQIGDDVKTARAILENVPPGI